MTTDTTTNRPTRNDQPVVSLRSIAVAFGGLLALEGIDLEVGHGERLAVLGPNGAGKTTLFNVIAGDIVPTRGTVVLQGRDCTMSPSRMRPGLGVARTYQKTRLFNDLTVEDNLYLSQTGKQRRHLSWWRGRRDAELRDGARAIARRVWLAPFVDTKVADLSHGQRRQLEIGMALASDPEIMLLDEPASGLSRGERERLVELIEQLEPELTLLLIEHDMDVALRVADRVVVMADGVLVAGGTPDEIRHDPLVHEIYLGREGDS
ncbi:amino acid/amide ABC transporter ATP-binding protein 1 (HAAT family) [Ilumatobacter fluminis]|uniref:Amino acid/amide ABC transporter ATP-binding protein 1 (HAAT family) n=1 Tax=Ilumatobacter fluminis TaxID=467091 RepID=A0A4R7I5Z2_9ACTN|nr:ABC transporter ATP-binding protein [Ilumatobacter fluminis]TDT18133.1 amino acid/amide ABC transporter ATP-binding protein 1 (HAAT family) [Ilumatobacter fluminis]